MCFIYLCNQCVSSPIHHTIQYSVHNYTFNYNNLIKTYNKRRHKNTDKARKYYIILKCQEKMIQWSFHAQAQCWRKKRGERKGESANSHWILNIFYEQNTWNISKFYYVEEIHYVLFFVPSKHNQIEGSNGPFYVSCFVLNSKQTTLCKTPSVSLLSYCLMECKGQFIIFVI